MTLACFLEFVTCLPFSDPSGTVFANMRLSSFVGFLSLAAGIALAPHVTQAAPLPLNAVVRVEVRATRTNQLLSSGTGLTIDPDGRVLVSNVILDPTAKDPHVSVSVCTIKTATDVPECWQKAAIVRRNLNLGLALLQITSLHVGDAWISPEEHAIRTGFRFSYHTPALENQTREDVALGESLSALQYGTVGTSIRQQTINVTGFARRTNGKTTQPNLVQFSPKLTDRSGGVAFNASGTFIGFLTGQERFASVPLVNRFLGEALSTKYLERKIPFLLVNEFVGKQNGLLNTRVCPTYATADSGSGLCRCNPGFFAIGNSCMVGITYCALAYPGRGQYDAFAKTCTCHNDADGRESCPKPTPLNKPAPKPVVPTGPSSPLSSTPFYCPLNAHYDAPSWSCVCNASYTKNNEKTACVTIK